MWLTSTVDHYQIHDMKESDGIHTQDETERLSLRQVGFCGPRQLKN